MASRRPPADSSRPSTAAPPPPTASTSATSANPPTPTTQKGPATTARKPKAPRAETVTTPPTRTSVDISEDTRRGMIAEAAYLRAERRGFSGGPDREREDWLAAEAEVDALLKAGHGSSAQ